MSSIDRSVTNPVVNFSPPGIANVSNSAIISKPTAAISISTPSGDMQLGGTSVFLDPVFTKANQSATNIVAEVSGALGSPQEKMSVNDLAAELMIIMLKSSLENKNTERQMRAELSQIQFQNGMKMADLIKQKGETAYKKAVTQAVTQLTSAVVSLASQKITEMYLSRKNKDVGLEVQGNAETKENEDGMKQFKSTQTQKRDLTELEKHRALQYGGLVGNLSKETASCMGNLIASEFDLDISKMEAQQKVLETMNKLIDSITASVDSSIKSQESAMQFAMSMLQQLNSLAFDGCMKIINNSVV